MNLNAGGISYLHHAFCQSARYYLVIIIAETVADALLLRFCVHFERFYRGSAVTPNIHMHCHLVDYIKDFGPVI